MLPRIFSWRQFAAIREGKSYDMLAEMRNSGIFHLPDHVWEKVSDLSQYVGRAPWQVEELIAEYVDPLIEKYTEDLGIEAEIRV